MRSNAQPVRGQGRDRITSKGSLKIPDANRASCFVGCPKGTDFPSNHSQPHRPSSGPARSLTLWVPVRGIFVPLQSWFPAVTACSLDTSSARRLPPFSGHGAVELRAVRRGRSLTCRPRPGHAPRPRPGAAPQPTPPAGKDTPRLEHAPPPPVSLRPLPICQCPGLGRPRPSSTPFRFGPPRSNATFPEQFAEQPEKAAPLDTPLHAPRFCKLPMHVSDLRMPQNGPEPLRPSPLHTILASPRPSRAELRSGMAEDRRQQPGAIRDERKALTLWCAKHCAKILQVLYVILEFSSLPYKVGAIILPFYQTRKLRLRGRNRLIQGHAVSRRQSLGWIHSAALPSLAPH